jgi:hypothetical protein
VGQHNFTAPWIHKKLIFFFFLFVEKKMNVDLYSYADSAPIRSSLELFAL